LIQGVAESNLLTPSLGVRRRDASEGVEVALVGVGEGVPYFWVVWIRAMAHAVLDGAEVGSYQIGLAGAPKG